MVVHFYINDAQRVSPNQTYSVEGNKIHQITVFHDGFNTNMKGKCNELSLATLL